MMLVVFDGRMFYNYFSKNTKKVPQEHHNPLKVDCAQYTPFSPYNIKLYPPIKQVANATFFTKSTYFFCFCCHFFKNVRIINNISLTNDKTVNGSVAILLHFRHVFLIIFLNNLKYKCNLISNEHGLYFSMLVAMFSINKL